MDLCVAESGAGCDAGRESVLERLRAILSDLLLLGPQEMRDDSLLVDELGIDSLGFLDLSFTIEERFGVEFPDVKSNLELLSEPIPVALHAMIGAPGATTLFAFIQAEWARNHRERLDDQSAAALAAAVGGRVPRDVSPETSIASIRLHTLLRFVTVQTMARYVEQLVASRGPARH
jgi:acyl carrier protein